MIENTVNGKLYIGSSVHIYRRFSTHKLDLRKGRHHSVKLQRAWDKYGGDSFIMKPVLFCDRSNLKFYEQLLLDHYQTAKNTVGYNMSPSSNGIAGYEYTDEQQKTISGDKRRV